MTVCDHLGCVQLWRKGVGHNVLTIPAQPVRRQARDKNPPHVGIKGLALLIHMLCHLHKLIFDSYVFIFSSKFLRFYFINIKFTDIKYIAFYMKFYMSVSMLYTFHPFLNEFAILMTPTVFISLYFKVFIFYQNEQWSAWKFSRKDRDDSALTAK